MPKIRQTLLGIANLENIQVIQGPQLINPNLWEKDLRNNSF